VPPTNTPVPVPDTPTPATDTPVPPTNTPKARLRVGQVTDMGGIDDKGLNAATWKGIQDAMDQLDIEGKRLESQQQGDYVENIQQFLDEDVDLIITVGSSTGVDTAKAANDNLKTNFAIVDYSYPDCLGDAVPGEDCGSAEVLDNVLGLTFATDEAAFLAGYLAAGMSETGKVGTFGAIKTSPITACMKGFDAGVTYYNIKHDTKVEVLGWDTATSEGRFMDSAESIDDGRRLAESLINEDADIVLPVVTGPVGLGAAAVCQERDKMLIGVDTDWFESAPDYKEVYLTSIVKKVDKAVFETIKSVVDGTFKGGIYVGTLENDGVGIASFHAFEDLVPDTLKEDIEDVKADLIAGTITVDGVLALEPTEIYVVESGDNLSDIARRYGTTPDVLMELNNLESTTIYPGDKLIVPKKR